MIASLLAKLPYEFDLATFIIRALAVVGGAVLGGFAIGLFVNLLIRLVTTKKMPGKVHWVVRSLGGLLAGWIMALLLFGGGGGSGIGGTGGLGFGGTGEGPGNRGDGEPPTKDLPPTKETGNPISSPTTELRLEVLGDPALGRLGVAGKKIELNRCYRIEGEEPPRLRTLAELKQLILRRLDQQPALKRIEIVLYTDSPGRKVKRVADLEEWLDDLAASRKDPAFSYNVNDKVPIEAPIR